MKEILTAFCIVVFQCILFSQTTVKSYHDVSVKPEFPGGDEALNNYLQGYISKLPPSCQESFVVFYEFQIDVDGSVTDIVLIASENEKLSAKADSIMRHMPKWKPGEHAGKPVKVQHQITFNVAEDCNVYQMEEVDEKPEFSLGEKEFIQFVNQQILYPKSAKDKQTEGVVFISFIVETDGSLSDVKIHRSADEALDREALRVIRMSPAWKPGKVNGVAVRVKYIFPVKFILN